MNTAMCAVVERALDVSGTLLYHDVTARADELLRVMKEEGLTLGKALPQVQWHPEPLRELWGTFGKLMPAGMVEGIVLPQTRPHVGLRVTIDGKAVEETPSWLIRFALGERQKLPVVISQAFGSALGARGYSDPTWKFNRPTPFAEKWVMPFLSSSTMGW